MIPDINYFIDEPAFHNTQLSDLFFFHYTFDKVLPETDLFFAAEVFLILMAVNLFAVALSVETFKRLKEALFGKEEEEDDDEEEGEEKSKEGIEEGEKKKEKDEDDDDIKGERGEGEEDDENGEKREGEGDN